MSWGKLVGAVAAVCVVAATFPPASRATGPSLTVADSPLTFLAFNGSVGVSIQKAPWRLGLTDGSGQPIVVERDPALPDQTTNATMRANANFDSMGHDRAYPGLPTVSVRPLAYLREGTWEHVTSFIGAKVAGAFITIAVTTSDGTGGTVSLHLRPGAVDLHFAPGGSSADAVGESFTASPTEHYFGGGGRFIKPDLTGLTVPLWASHGVGADGYAYTNEIAVPYAGSTAGWAMYERTGARGAMAFNVPERPGTVSAFTENASLELTLYAGPLQQTLSAFTSDEGRSPVAPQWAFTPMWWDDNQNTQAEVTTNIAKLRDEGVPVGAYWIDNPFQDHQGDFAPSTSRFPDFDGFVAALHEQGIRLMTWVSPFWDARSRVAALGAVPVAGMPTDRDDHTYVPARGLSDHVDLTDPTSYDAEVSAAADLLSRGVDGFKLDRGEEDYGDGARFSDGTPNRLEHARYVLAYDRAMRAACERAHPDGDCFLVARGGVAGSSHEVANWAGDTLVSESQPGLLSAVHSLLSNALSGQPVWGSDVGGYGGRSRDPANLPTAGTFVRWAQFGAVSPVMESPNHPSDYDGATVAAIRTAALLHQRLAPYTWAAARRAARTGVPIAQPLVLAFPDDAASATIDDEYVFDGCLLAAPLTTGVEQEGPATRTVYLPAGGWTNVYSGVRRTGPMVVTEASAYDEFPLYEADGCDVPKSVFEKG